MVKVKVKAKAPKRKPANAAFPACPNCGSHSVYYVGGEKRWVCKRCGNRYPATVKKGAKKA